MMYLYFIRNKLLLLYTFLTILKTPCCTRVRAPFSKHQGRFGAGIWPAAERLQWRAVLPLCRAPHLAVGLGVENSTLFLILSMADGAWCDRA